VDIVIGDAWPHRAAEQTELEPPRVAVAWSFLQEGVAMGRVDGRVALVTGGSGGLGSAFASALAREGADVAIQYHSHPERAEEVAEEVRRAGRRAHTVTADLADMADVRAMFASVGQELGDVDILVNNAGVDGERARAWEIDPDSWRKTVELNLFGTYYCAREALSGMVSRGRGVVVNISSVHEVIPWGGYSAYATAKAAVSMLTKTLALETAEYGVRVVALAPGAIRTPINADVWQDPQGLADLERKIPARRIGEPDEVAAVLVSLVSDEASYLTGTTVFVDGGMTLYADFAHGG